MARQSKKRAMELPPEDFDAAVVVPEMPTEMVEDKRQVGLLKVDEETTKRYIAAVPHSEVPLAKSILPPFTREKK